MISAVSIPYPFRESTTGNWDAINGSKLDSLDKKNNKNNLIEAGFELPTFGWESVTLPFELEFNKNLDSDLTK